MVGNQGNATQLARRKGRKRVGPGRGTARIMASGTGSDCGRDVQQASAKSIVLEGA